MNWRDELSQFLDRYAGSAGGTASAPANVHQDFDQVAQKAPPEKVAGGLAEAFRSEQTPPFSEMVASLFHHSNADQRKGLLERLMPGVSVTPQQANQVTTEQVKQTAAQAERDNPSIVDEVSRFYAQHPNVVKALGGVVLAYVIRHVAREI